MSSHAFENFIYSFGAARVLLRRAHDNGFLIEGMALYASLVDGFLRIGLLLKRQLVRKTHEIDNALVEQKKGVPFFTERQIYKMSYDEGVIDEATFVSLSRMYDRRNDIIHKFFLTAIAYESLAADLVEYERLFNELHTIVYRLEADQIEQGVGMTVRGRGSTHSETLRAVMKKIETLPDGST